MSLLTCAEDCTLTVFARAHNVHLHDLWLPLEAALPSRVSHETPVTIDADTPIALLDSTTNTLTFDKRSICARLHVDGAATCDRTAVRIPPSAAPPGFTVFVRWTGRGTKRLRAPAQLLHYVTEGPTPESPRSSVSAAKRSRTENGIVGGGGGGGTSGGCSSSVDASTLADTLRSTQHRFSLQQRSNEDLRRRLSAALAARGRPLPPRSLHIAASTLANIRHHSSQPPLHFVLPPEAEVLEAGGVRWARANHRLLSRVFRSTSSEERSEASRYSDGARQVRFYFIEDVLLRRPRTWEAKKRSEGGGEKEREATDVGTAAEAVEYLLKGKLLEDMNRHAERGHRIVLLEHYPVLHHASRFTVEQTLAPVARLCRECCPHLTVTVVLSTVSYVTAMRRQGMELSFVVPHAGLLQFFVAELNTSLRPDAKTAAVVGSAARGSEFLAELHRDFARNASLTYVEVSELQ